VRDGNHAELANIILGRDFGGEVEVVSGLQADDDVIVNPPDSLISGETVRVAAAQSSGQAQGQAQAQNSQGKQASSGGSQK
jgi:hypothetical protein